jgi:hypothetical protein
VFPTQGRPGGRPNSNDVFVAAINLAPIIQKRFLPTETNPTLFITQSNGIVTLSWPDLGGNFILESNPTLSSGGWTPVSQGSILGNGRRSITLPATSSSGFFRLQYP